MLVSCHTAQDLCSLTELTCLLANIRQTHELMAPFLMLDSFESMLTEGTHFACSDCVLLLFFFAFHGRRPSNLSWAVLLLCVCVCLAHVS
jgi:hypothetical protein